MSHGRLPSTDPVPSELPRATPSISTGLQPEPSEAVFFPEQPPEQPRVRNRKSEAGGQDLLFAAFELIEPAPHVMYFKRNPTRAPLNPTYTNCPVHSSHRSKIFFQRTPFVKGKFSGICQIQNRKSEIFYSCTLGYEPSHLRYLQYGFISSMVCFILSSSIWPSKSTKKK